MPISPDRLYFARPTIAWAVDPGERVAQSAISDDLEVDIETLGIVNAPEAFFSKQARDEALGPAVDYVTFVPTTWTEATAAGFGVSRIAIGPKFGEEGFSRIAGLVMPALIDEMLDFEGTSESITICRTKYHFGVRDGEAWAASERMTHTDEDKVQIERTMKWLTVRVQRELSSRDAVRE